MQEQSELKVSRVPRQPRRSIPATEKCKAVLAIWTERRSVSEICRELAVARVQVERWQEQAMEAMLLGLESSSRQEKCPALNGRLEKLLEKRLPRRQAKMNKLAERLESVQQQNPSTETQ